MIISVNGQKENEDIDAMPKAARELKNVKLSSVSLVDRGANNKRFQVIKSHDADEKISLIHKLLKMLGIKGETEAESESSEKDREATIVVSHLRKAASDAQEKLQGTRYAGILKQYNEQLNKLEIQTVGNEDTPQMDTIAQISGLQKRIEELEKALSAANNAQSEDIVENDKEILTRNGINEVVKHDNIEQYVNDEIASGKSDIFINQEEYVALEKGKALGKTAQLRYADYVRYLAPNVCPMEYADYKKYMKGMRDKGFVPAFDQSNRPMMTKSGAPRMVKADFMNPEITHPGTYPGNKPKGEEEYATGNMRLKKEGESQTPTTPAAQATAGDSAQQVLAHIAPAMETLTKSIGDIANRLAALEQNSNLDKIEKRLEKMENIRPGSNGGTVAISKAADPGSVDNDNELWKGVF